MRGRLAVLVAAATAAVDLLVTAPAAHAATAPPGPVVGFWAGEANTRCVSADPTAFCPRDLSVYTPAVWDALAKGHGALYFNLSYTSDFGPPAAGALRTDGLAIVQEANRHGIEVKAWLTVPIAHGTYANEDNADFMSDAVKALVAWRNAHHLKIDEAVLDLELPVGYQPVVDAMDPAKLLAMRGTIDPPHQCAAMRTYAATVSWAHQHGLVLSATPVPFEIDDLADGNVGLADAIDLGPLLPDVYDHVYVQAYRTYSNTGANYPATYLRAMHHYFGSAGEVSLGDTTMGPPYTDKTALATDVRMLAAMGATAIPIFDFDATAKSLGPAGLLTLLTAGQHPMSAAELAAAQAPNTLTTATLGFFDALDRAASTASPNANAWPDGCGTFTVAPLVRSTSPIPVKTPAGRPPHTPPPPTVTPAHSLASTGTVPWTSWAGLALTLVAVVLRRVPRTRRAHRIG